MIKQVLLSTLLLSSMVGCSSSPTSETQSQVPEEAKSIQYGPEPTSENYLTAISAGDIEVLKLLDKQHFRYLKTTTGDAKHPIHYAISKGRYEVIKYLVGAGYDINGLNEPKKNQGLGVTPLVYAVKLEDIQAIELLLSLGADIEEGGNESPLHAALDTRNFWDSEDDKLPSVEIVSLLLSEGANPNGRHTPLRVAAMEGSGYGVVKLLLEAGADPTLTDDDGENLLHWAARTSDREGYDKKAIQLLVNAGADVHAKQEDRMGITPLALSAWLGSTNVALALIENGARINDLYPSYYGKEATVLDIAIDKNNPETAKALRQKGAKRANEL